MNDIREYSEGYDVEIEHHDENDRLVITAYNQSKYDCTQVDMLDLIAFIKEEMPELLNEDDEDDWG